MPLTPFEFYTRQVELEMMRWLYALGIDGIALAIAIPALLAGWLVVRRAARPAAGRVLPPTPFGTPLPTAGAGEAA